MNPSGGRREGSGRPPRGDRPTVTKCFSLTPACIEKLESSKPEGTSMSAHAEQLILQALGEQ